MVRMRWLVLCLALIGCSPATEYPPPGTFSGYPAVMIAESEIGPATPDKPQPQIGDECWVCGGSGRLGDGTIETPCRGCKADGRIDDGDPAIDPDWEPAGEPTRDPNIVPDPPQQEKPKVSVLQKPPPPPVVVDHPQPPAKPAIIYEWRGSGQPSIKSYQPKKYRTNSGTDYGIKRPWSRKR